MRHLESLGGDGFNCIKGKQMFFTKGVNCGRMYSLFTGFVLSPPLPCFPRGWQCVADWAFNIYCFAQGCVGRQNFPHNCAEACNVLVWFACFILFLTHPWEQHIPDVGSSFGLDSGIRTEVKEQGPEKL